MGAKDNATQWERAILERENLSGWRVQRIPNEGYCWSDRKLIQCTRSRALFLHEVAHALRERDAEEVPLGDSPHDAWWGSIFTRLVAAELEQRPTWEQVRDGLFKAIEGMHEQYGVRNRPHYESGLLAALRERRIKESWERADAILAEMQNSGRDTA